MSPTSARGEAQRRREEARRRRRSAAEEQNSDGDAPSTGDDVQPEPQHGGLAQAMKVAAAAAAVGAAAGAARAITDRDGRDDRDEDRQAHDAPPAEPDADEALPDEPEEEAEEEPLPAAEHEERDEPSSSVHDEPEPDVEPEPVTGGTPTETAEVVRRAREELTALRGYEPESVSELARTPDGWTVTFELVEVARVPDTTDVMASYELVLDDDANLIRYARIRRYSRAQAQHEDGP